MSNRKVCIVGTGQSEFTRWGGIMDRSQFQITAEAIRDALTDAGLTARDLDGFASFSNDANEGNLMQVALGAPELRWCSMVWGGGGGGSMAALSQACAAVASGSADVVAVYRGLCQGQSRRFGQFSKRTHGNFIGPYGLFAPSQMLSLQMQRFMHQYPITADHMCELALSARANANRNPKAVLYEKPLTREEYFAGRWIAEPFRIYDCCLETDGACAVIVTTEERARDLPGMPVRVLAATHGGGAGWGTGPLGSQNMPDETYASTNARSVARRLYEAAGVSASDIDVAQIYDNFLGMVLMALEDYGFCAKGESGEFVASGAIRWPDGKLPINTSGGQVAEAYVHGMNILIEGVRQIRGTSTSQVKDAEVCLVAGGLGVSPTSGAIIARL